MITENETIISRIRRAQSGDRAECSRLIEENSALIKSIARRYYGRGADQDDLYQLGCIGMVKAIYGFDESFGTAFSTYAVPKIAGEMRRFLRDDGMIKISRSAKASAYKVLEAREKLTKTLGREPCLSEISQETGLSIEEIAQSDIVPTSVSSFSAEFGENGIALEDVIGSNSPEDEVLDKILLLDAIDTLPQNEQQVIKLRFFKSLTQQQIARILNISQVQVSRLEKRALEKLRKLLK